MTETAPTHSEDPAEGVDAGPTEAAGRTPHAEEPAEGSVESSEHSDEADAESGLDPDNRITGA